MSSRILGVTQTNSKKFELRQCAKKNMATSARDHATGLTSQIRFCASIISRWCIAHPSDLRDLRGDLRIHTTAHRLSGIASGAGEIGSTVIKLTTCPGKRGNGLTVTRQFNCPGEHHTIIRCALSTNPRFDEYLIWLDRAIDSREHDYDGHRTMPSTSFRFHKWTPPPWTKEALGTAQRVGLVRLPNAMDTIPIRAQWFRCEPSRPTIDNEEATSQFWELRLVRDNAYDTGGATFCGRTR
ncbi:hypothetical protein EDB83DRAFT_2553874 [Lactarius deliciosus]|nr:hypothetical protein EDB83DRAFT_2553874 [Lactarius deliciosus]